MAGQPGQPSIHMLQMNTIPNIIYAHGCAMTWCKVQKTRRPFPCIDEIHTCMLVHFEQMFVRYIAKVVQHLMSL